MFNKIKLRELMLKDLEEAKNIDTSINELADNIKKVQEAEISEKVLRKKKRLSIFSFIK